MKELIAYCGLDCETCEAFIATQNNDDELKAKVASEWSKLNNARITPEMINCDGCRANGRKTPFCSYLCEIKKCASSRVYKTCGDCKCFSSCETLKMITNNNAQALNNLENK